MSLYRSSLRIPSLFLFLFIYFFFSHSFWAPSPHAENTNINYTPYQDEPLHFPNRLRRAGAAPAPSRSPSVRPLSSSPGSNESPFLATVAGLPTASGLIAPIKTAYVAIHIHDDATAANNWISINGIRTMFATLSEASPGDSRQRIAMVSQKTDQYIRDMLAGDGVKVIDLPPLEWPEPCEKTFSKIYLWSLVAYERVVFLDSDVLVQRPLDELFACGHFCMVYSSILHFTDSVFVVRPDESVYKQLMDSWRGLALADRGIGSSRLFDVFTGNACQHESWHFFIRIFGDLEAAPLFPHEEATALGVTHQATAMRLQASISLNAMMFYENFSWRLMRSPQFRNYTDQQGIPAYTLAFTSLKPYSWVQGIFFNLSWDWHVARDRLLGISHTRLIVISCLLLLLQLYGVEFGLRRFFQWLYAPSTVGAAVAAFRQLLATVFGHYFPYVLAKYGVNNLSIVFGIVYPIVTTTILCFTIPPLNPPHIVWPIFIGIHVLLIYATLKCIGIAYFHQASLQKTSRAHGRPKRGGSVSRDDANAGDGDEAQALISRGGEQQRDHEGEREASHDHDHDHDHSNTTSPLFVPLSAPTLITRSTSTGNMNSSDAADAHNDEPADDKAPAPLSLSSSLSSASLSSLSLSIASSSLDAFPGHYLAFNLFDLLPLFIWEWLVFGLMRLRVYPEFVVKMFAIFPLIVCVLLCSVNLTRKVFFQIAKCENIRDEGKDKR